MKLGILADTHEYVDELRQTIGIQEERVADRFVALGDVINQGTEDRG